MKHYNKKTLIIYTILIIYILFSFLIGYPQITNLMNTVINPISFILLFFLSLYITDNQPQRIKNKTNKLQTTFIVVFTYLVVYALSGLVIGYGRSIYSHTIISTLQNLWIYITPIIFMELIRNILVKNIHKDMKIYILIVILFSLIDINLYTIINTEEITDLFKIICSTVIPMITMNMTLTYTSKVSGYINNLIYRIPQTLTLILLPILPSLDWYFEAMIGILLPVLNFILIKNIHDKEENTESVRKYESKKITKLIPLMIPILIFIMFVAGVFKYKPTAIMSNSMHPVFDRGDVVIAENTNKKMLKNLKNYDIIEYILDQTTMVAHRIIYVEEHNDGTKLYVTKGDNNNMADIKKVKQDQVIGKVIFRIPKIGYPSVWLNDFFNKNKKIAVETGK